MTTQCITRKINKKRQDKRRRVRALKINKALKKMFPKAQISLHYSNPWELMVAVILSARCTDKKVNEVTKRLFKKYGRIDDYVKASLGEFEKDIKGTGFYRNKAKNILASAKILRENFGGKVPCEMAELLRLPGVARKTANVIIGNACGKVEGIAVDTHVKRFVRKFELSDSKNQDKIEKDLMELFPKKDWSGVTYRFIEYGRSVCPGRRHECAEHPLTKIFPRAAHIWPKTQ